MDSIRLSLVKLSWDVKQVSRMDQIDQMESNGLHSTKPNGQMVSCCISTQALKQVSRMDQIDQMESNWTPFD